MNITANIPEPDKKGLRDFGLTTGAILVVLFGLLLPWLFDHALPVWPWIIAAVLAVWALAIPNTLRPVYRGWMAVGHVLGWVNTRIILGIMFYLIFLPTGLIMRILGKDPMARKFTADKSYRVLSSEHPRDQFERPY